MVGVVPVTAPQVVPATAPVEVSATAPRTVRALVLTALVVAISVAGAVAPQPVEAVVGVQIHDLEVSGGATFAADGAVVSRAMDTPGFAMVALSLDDEVAVEVRTALDDGPWSPWTAMPHMHDEGPDPTSPEGLGAATTDGTHPFFTGAADRLQVRAVDGALDGVTAHLIDPFGLDRSVARRAWDRMVASWRGGTGSVATAMADLPNIVTRAEWGADESIVGSAPAYARQVDRVFIHHTVGSNGYSQAEAAGVVRGVQAYHVNGRGWNDIGYNLLVDRFGTIYEGRAGGVDQAVIGAQAGGFNTFSSGVALMGTYTDATPAPEMVAAVESIVAWKADVHHFDPLGTSEATSAGSTRFPAGQVVTLPNVAGHRDVSTTTCPGNGPYGLLDTIRQGVAERVGNQIVDHGSDVLSTRVIRGNPDADRVTLSARLKPPGDWRIEVYNPALEVVHTAEGSGETASTVVSLDGDAWELGDYEWSVAADGRRAAFEHFTLEPPVIEATAVSADPATADADGRLDPPLAVSATLWPDAAWSLEIRDPDGAVVHTQTGQGTRLEGGWFSGVGEPGAYELTITAEDAVPVQRSLEVRYDLLDRLADTDDPVAAATLIAGAAFPSGSATRAVVARHDVFADALAGGPLAGPDGPLLLTPSDALDGRVAAELERVLAPDATIYVLGGAQAIAEHVADQLGQYGTVVRLSGASRFATAVAVAEVVVDRSGTTQAMVARAGPDDAAPWADALSGGAYGAAAGVPVLLVDTDRLPGETAAAVDALGLTRTTILGGTAAISDDVAAGLPGSTRLAGADRTGTAVEVAAQLWSSQAAPDAVLLANGYATNAWAWALAAAPMSARRGAPLLLTTPTVLAGPTTELLRELGASGGAVLGPSSLVDPEVSYAASDAIRRGR